MDILGRTKECESHFLMEKDPLQSKARTLGTRAARYLRVLKLHCCRRLNSSVCCGNKCRAIVSLKSGAMSLSTLKDAVKKYRDLVVTQPLVVSEVESVCRWLSYLASGKFFSATLLGSHGN